MISKYIGFPCGSVDKESPAMREAWVRPLGWEDPLEKGKVIHSSILTWGISMDKGAWWATVPWTKESGGLPSVGSQRVRHD